MKEISALKFNIDINNSTVKQFRYNIDLFIYKISVSYNKTVEYFNEWKILVIEQVTIALKINISDLVSINRKHLFQ